MPPPRDKNAPILLARALRRNMTLPEGMLWQALRKRPHGFKFRRQHPIGNFVVDFYCPAAQLALEVDGESHSMGERPKRDVLRDKWLQEQGVKVVRFAASDVIRDLRSD
jgi:very-short-patch-repair endonuclease